MNITHKDLNSSAAFGNISDEELDGEIRLAKQRARHSGINNLSPPGAHALEIDNNIDKGMDAILNADGNVILTGPTGTGKTTLMFLTCRALICFDYAKVRAYDFAELAEICLRKTSFEALNAGEGLSLLAAQLAQSGDILFIDDIRELDNYAMQKVITLFEHLYRHEVRIFCTTNFDSAGLERAMGSRVASRLLQDATVLVLKRESYRKPKAIIELN